MSALPRRTFTPQEYAMLEKKAPYKSQYVAGEVFAMAGVQPWHDAVVQNLTGMFYVRFRGRPCRTFSADVKVRVEAGDLWTYADLSALCGTPDFDRSARPFSLLNPQVIVEVLDLFPNSK